MVATILIVDDNARLRALMREIVAEAYENVERGLMTDSDFRDFTFNNPLAFFAGSDPDFFKGTRVETAAIPVTGD